MVTDDILEQNMLMYEVDIETKGLSKRNGEWKS
jgi:hypothetical protein